MVVINLAHAAADGFGLMTMANTLLCAYLDPLSVPSRQEGLPARDTLWTADLIEGDVADHATEVETSMWPSICGRSRDPSLYHRAVIPQDEVQRIKQAANRCGGTINDLLLSAHFLTLSDMTGHRGPHSLSFPVNLRKHLNDGTNHEQSGSQYLLPHPKDSRRKDGGDAGQGHKGDQAVEGRIGRIREQVAFDRSCDPEGKVVHGMVEDMARMQDDGLANIFISNPGHFPLPAVNGLRDAYICYPGS